MARGKTGFGQRDDRVRGANQQRSAGCHEGEEPVTRALLMWKRAWGEGLGWWSVKSSWFEVVELSSWTTLELVCEGEAGRVRRALAGGEVAGQQLRAS